MKFSNKFLAQYAHLSKEIYVLFWGSTVTSMGALIWPLLTLILKNKLGYDATTIATISMGMTILQFPMLLLGGKLADTKNRKKIIVVCDLVTVFFYVICGILPLSGYSIAFFYIAGLFATIESPSYNALIADLSDSESREKAYSLQYLGNNLGLVLAPTLGGLLFENHLGLAFLITAGATLSSTLLIIFFVKRQKVEQTKVSVYEQRRDNTGLFAVLRERWRPLLIYVLLGAFGSLVYAQFNYLLPLNLEMLYGAKGAELFGLLTSVNALTVIIATPLITTFLGRISDVWKIFIGETLIVLGLFGYRFVQYLIPLYFALMVLFTVGEVFNTLGNQPYMTRRMPSTHWGRINSWISVICGVFSAMGNLVIGKVVDGRGYDEAWLLVGIFGAATILSAGALGLTDRKNFPLLYKRGR